MRPAVLLLWACFACRSAGVDSPPDFTTQSDVAQPSSGVSTPIEDTAHEVRIVNLIPRQQSGESHHDTEPSIGVWGDTIVVFSQTRSHWGDEDLSFFLPYFWSADGGDSWNLSQFLAFKGGAPRDPTVGAGRQGFALSHLQPRRTPSAAPAADTALVVWLREVTEWEPEYSVAQIGVDQPRIATMQAVGGNDIRMLTYWYWIGEPGRVQWRQSEDEGQSWMQGEIAPGSTPDATHGNTTRLAVGGEDVYLAFFRLGQELPQELAASGGEWEWVRGGSELLVLKRTAAGGFEPPEGVQTDGIPGVVRSNILLPYPAEVMPKLGQERLSLSLAVATHPAAPDNVIVAWVDLRIGQGGASPQLHVIRSRDGGATWSDDLLTIPNAITPELAMDESGTAGLLYRQHVVEEDGERRWLTVFTRLVDGVPDEAPIVLANTADTVAVHDAPYHGDYSGLVAAGGYFHGVFSAFNPPIEENFLVQPDYDRHVEGDSLYQLSPFERGTRPDPVCCTAPSIDPFYFRIRIQPSG